MRRLFLFSCLLLISVYCFGQQNLPAKITGNIPDRNSLKEYQIQVGAYKLQKNADDAILLLKKNALNPVTEKYLDFTRVMIKGIPANQVVNYLAIIKQAGFNEALIREDHAGTISEKWEIRSPDSAFSSFEFNHNRHYIAVGNDNRETVLFGEYSIPQKDVIDLDKLGTVHIQNSSNTGVDFSFFPIDEGGKEIRLSAAKAEAMAGSPKMDLLCRTWKVVYCTDEDAIGLYVLISNSGTYFFTEVDGIANRLSSWRWFNEDMEEFEYSHDEWVHYGRAEILNLTVDSLEIFDPGYFSYTRGYSRGNGNDYYELVPVDN